MCLHAPDVSASKTISFVFPGLDFHVPKPIHECGPSVNAAILYDDNGFFKPLSSSLAFSRIERLVLPFHVFVVAHFSSSLRENEEV